MGHCPKVTSIMVWNKQATKWAVAVFWLAVWQVAAMCVGYSVLLPTPLETANALVRMIPTADFWGRVGLSLLWVGTGFVLGAFLGVILAGCSAACIGVRHLLNPVVLLAKTTPVASFVILALVWMPSKRLPVFISFLMVFPVIYTAVLQGIEQTDAGLLEMAKVFRISLFKQVKAIYLPQVFPYFYSACSTALGLAWKSGIAAEIIGLSPNTVGEALYEAKVFLMTDEMFAWTAVVIVASMLFEKCVLGAMRYLQKSKWEKQNAN